MFDVDAIIALFRQLQADPAFCPRMTLYLNLSGVRFDGIGHVQMDRLVTALHALHGDRYCLARTAIHAADDLSFGMARMLQGVARSRGAMPPGIFRDAQSAMDCVARGRAARCRPVSRAA